MHLKLNELSEKAKLLIGQRLAKNDVDAVRLLSEVAVRLKRFQEQAEALEKDIEGVDGLLNGVSAQLENPLITNPEKVTPEINLDFEISGSRSPGKKLRIELDWNRAEKAWDTEVLSDNLASSTVARFLGRLVDAYGPTIIDKLVRFRVNRGPLVSKNPQHDFLNRSTGKAYGHQEIRGTSYSVLTHSSTAQKVKDIKEMCRFLGLPIGLVKVSETEKSPSRASFLASL